MASIRSRGGDLARRNTVFAVLLVTDTLAMIESGDPHLSVSKCDGE